MLALIKLECIGGMDWGLSPNDVFLTKLFLGGLGPPRYWVAQITGRSGGNGYDRQFLKAKTDYTHSNSKGTRGVYACYLLESGHIYEVSSPVSWKRVDRYFCRAVDGHVQRITKVEVDQCLRQL